MHPDAQIIYNEILITVRKETPTFTVYFSNTPGNFEPLHNVDPIRGLLTPEEAVQAGKNFIDAHAWQYTTKIGIFDIYVRHWYNGDWGYSVRADSCLTNESGFRTKGGATQAGTNCAKREISELNEKDEITCRFPHFCTCSECVNKWHQEDERD